MSQPSIIGLVFIKGFADWEYGLLAASAVEWFGDTVVSLSPEGQPVTSIGGISITPIRGTEPEENADLDAVVLIGSDTWAANDTPDVGALISRVKDRGGVIAGICAGTLALARAGLFETARHTSNGREWIAEHLPDYAGIANYVDVPQAVTDGALVTAPGSAPGTFAVSVLEALHPDKSNELAQMRALFRREYENDGQASVDAAE